MYHIPRSNNVSMSNDELKEKMFVWVYDSKNQGDEQR